jgi:hypothetical protein
VELQENQQLHLVLDKIATTAVVAVVALEIPIRFRKEAVMRNLTILNKLARIFLALQLFYKKTQELAPWIYREKLVRLKLKTKSSKANKMELRMEIETGWVALAAMVLLLVVAKVPRMAEVEVAEVALEL